MSAIDSISPLFIGLGIIAALSVIIEIGYRIGLRIGDEPGLSRHPIEATVTTAILSLMAFMLGFSFASASSRFSKRRDLALADANASGTLYLRADFLPEERANSARPLIQEYTKLRAEAVEIRDQEQIAPFLKRSSEIQTELWDLAVLSRSESKNVSLNLFITSLNELIDIDAKRRATALAHRFPPILWYTLTFLGVVSTVMLGISSGLHGRRSRLAATALIISFSLVIVLIVDLDRPIRTFVKQVNSVEAEKLPE